MQQPVTGLRPLKARYPLLLICLGWACSAVADQADSRYVTDLLTACRDSPGIPFFGPAAGWAGLLAAATGTAWIVGQLAAVIRKRARPNSWTGGSLFAVLPVVLLVLLLQSHILSNAVDDVGHQRTHCMGLARPPVLPR
ncbi:hypothetical protein [Kitasatospora sp. NPDC057015]|uniref:hypothetical protein n=1 Tax=Kitasatospora sp. NPDC057015 TaxID=3346001 RepID=UPI00363C7E16